MSYLRYHHILLIGISVQKCENGEKKPCNSCFLWQAIIESPLRVTLFHQMWNEKKNHNSRKKVWLWKKADNCKSCNDPPWVGYARRCVNWFLSDDGLCAEINWPCQTMSEIDGAFHLRRAVPRSAVKWIEQRTEWWSHGQCKVSVFLLPRPTQ